MLRKGREKPWNIRETRDKIQGWEKAAAWWVENEDKGWWGKMRREKNDTAHLSLQTDPAPIGSSSQQSSQQSSNSIPDIWAGQLWQAKIFSLCRGISEHQMRISLVVKTVWKISSYIPNSRFQDYLACSHLLKILTVLQEVRLYINSTTWLFLNEFFSFLTCQLPLTPHPSLSLTHTQHVTGVNAPALLVPCYVTINFINCNTLPSHFYYILMLYSSAIQIAGLRISSWP